MSKPRKIGFKSTYIPNAKADMRYRKKVCQRGREKAGVIIRAPKEDRNEG